MERRKFVQASRLHYEGADMTRWIIALVFTGFLVIPSRGEDVKPPERYAAAVAALERWIEKEVEAKKLPGLALALVDDQTVVWSRGFGWQDEGHMMHASADTLWRVGSVSKPFT